MDIYHYDPYTGELIATGQADPDPRRPGEYLIPAFATAEQPPALGNHQAAVFAGGTWQIVDDYRGQTAYKTTDASPVQITDLGPVPEGHTLLVPCSHPTWTGSTWMQDNEAARATALDKKLAALSAYRYEKERAGITINGIQVKTDLESQEQMLKTMKYLEMKPAGTTVRWKGADRKWTPINLDDLKAMSEAVGDFSEACWRAEESHQIVIEGLTTNEEIETYDITTGWPI